MAALSRAAPDVDAAGTVSSSAQDTTRRTSTWLRARRGAGRTRRFGYAAYTVLLVLGSWYGVYMAGAIHRRRPPSSSNWAPAPASSPTRRWLVCRPARGSSRSNSSPRALTPAGRMTTFAYGHAAWMPTARRFAAELSASFGTVERTRTVWRNLPPAFVYRACHG
ncbi:hypothetical protein [Streptodolium elevatio]|uniref:Uncharacterized protein n=1 Tax=Streptodolium elevatio TaxID=3157996 RepID=A0ABV3DX68_9ACTN